MKPAGFQEHVGERGLHFERPLVLMSRSRAAYVGPGMELSPHKLAVATVAIARKAPFELDILDGRDAPTQVARLALILPDTLHHLRTSGTMVFLYLDAASDDYEGLDVGAMRDQEARILAVIESEFVRFQETKNAARLIQSICEGLDIPRRAISHPGVTGAMRAIDDQPQKFRTIQEAAAVAGLSVSRFQHVFRDVAGTPFRRYRLWKRMGVVAEVLSRGGNLTDAALEAGFSGSAHLSSTFRTMFGIKPSDLLAMDAEFIVDT